MYAGELRQQSPERKLITQHFRMDEVECVQNLLHYASLPQSAKKRIYDTAYQLILQVRKNRKGKGGMDAFMDQYDLSTHEGVVLMCLAEALLRIPDNKTKDQLIQDKLTSADWEQHLGVSDSFFVNASTWGLMLTGEVLDAEQRDNSKLKSVLKSWLGKTSKPFVRKAVDEAMKVLGEQFVMGQTIEAAIKRAKKFEAQGYRYSYDMLGEAAHTAADAARYLEAYKAAIEKIGQAMRGKTLEDGAGVSVKLSALYPRYEISHYDMAVKVLTERLLALARLAKKVQIKLTVDAEEFERLDMSLDIIGAVFSHPDLKDWDGLAIVIQAYQKRCFYLVDWVVDMAKQQGKRFMVRLVKGAYWDTDIKTAQMQGFNDYEVFTRKPSTDVSYIACARKLIAAGGELIYPQFATHNAYSVAVIIDLMGDRRDFEFQCLQGMGQPLYDEIVPEDKYGIPTRVYAPVGVHEDLLPYLVRRLLENGANTSFVNRIINEEIPVDALCVDPVTQVQKFDSIRHPKIPLPSYIYPDARLNARNDDLSNVAVYNQLVRDTAPFMEKEYQTVDLHGDKEPVVNPADTREVVGFVWQATPTDCDNALTVATEAFSMWDGLEVDLRAGFLDKAANLMEQHFPELMTLITREAGRTVLDAQSEIREAIDFCRYYAVNARKELTPRVLQGYTGETNRYEMHGRGVWLCISPWNFPVAIFTGQIVSALVAGNAVLAKPAEQTPLTGAYIVNLLHEAGVPQNVLQLLPGRGEVVGEYLVKDKRVKGVSFTGSTEVAHLINKTLADRGGEIVPFIAETGGQNCMIVDSSALPEQVVMDVLQSAFGSAGQRCSALRVLFVQEDIADDVVKMLQGAMQELNVGNPALLTSDVGPVIDQEAWQILVDHVKQMEEEAKLIAKLELDPSCANGTFFAPCAFEIESLASLPREVFGPVLHVIRYVKKDLPKVIEQINATGYGLTFGMHSRIDSAVQAVYRQVHVGNCYVNRNMIGAVVGLQPFGGQGLSGTGPKAGGIHTLTRLCHEKVLTINTTATGGNASLMSIGD